MNEILEDFPPVVLLHLFQEYITLNSQRKHVNLWHWREPHVNTLLNSLLVELANDRY
jgi:hypothetical protein